jgi:ankyrin repeat domain-containing protein 50
LGYFYFSFSDPAKQNAENMLRSIIKQLCGRRPDEPEALAKLVRYRDVNLQPDLESLINAFNESTFGFARVYVIIDALDECPLGQRSKLLDVLQTIKTFGLDNLHILYTSRAEADIESRFRSSVSRHEITRIDLEKRRREVNEDIRTYIDKELESSEFCSWPADIKARARKALIEKAHGM